MIKVFKDGDFKKRIVKFMIPFLIQELILVFTSLIGILMIETEPDVTEEMISGMTNAFQIFFIFNMSIVALTFIGNLFISQHYGRGHLDKIEEDMYVLLKFALIVAIIFTTISAAIPEQIMWIFARASTEGGPEIVKSGAEYLRFFSISYIPTAITMIYYCVMKNVKMEKFVVINSAYCLVLDILLNAILVWGTPHLGVTGVALALVIARIVECISAILIENIRGYIHFHFKGFIKLNLPLIKEFSRYIVLIFFAKFIWATFYAAISVVVGRTGDVEFIFSHSLMVQMKNIIITISTSAAAAVGIIIGRELGANRLTKAKEHGQDALRFAIFIGILQMVAFIVTFGIAYFTNLDKLQGNENTQQLIYLAILYAIYLTQLIPQAINSVLGNGLFSAGGDIKIVSLLDSFTGVVLLVPAILLVELANVNPILIFTIVIIEESVKAPIYIHHYKKGLWIKNIAGKGGFVFN
ncbi:MAG: hypothetical protein MJ206_03450 [Bacilli bacterium]|nr:hypothetical protein [Bacilli bacterium]